MAELGDRAVDEHRRIAELAEELGIDVVAVGTDLYGHDAVADPEAAAAEVLRRAGAAGDGGDGGSDGDGGGGGGGRGGASLPEGTAVLVKGSRVAGLRRSPTCSRPEPGSVAGR